jgi:hypothetical protein
MSPFRERDLRQAVHDLLEQTGAFDGVYLSGLPERRGGRASESRVVCIEPAETTETDPSDDWQGSLLLNCRLNLVFLARHDDPQVRDETAELLLNVAADALGGNTLGGRALPARTRIRSWSWQPASAPERRLTAVLECPYLVDGPTAFNTSE